MNRPRMTPRSETPNVGPPHLAGALPTGAVLSVQVGPEGFAAGFARFDRNLRYLAASKDGRLVGDATQVIGRKLSEVLGDEIAGVIRPYAERVFGGEQVTVELGVKLPTGEIRHRQVCFVPEVDSAGHVPSFIAISLDRTEHRWLEQALRESEQQLRSIVELEPECVKLIAPDGSLRSMNPAGLLMLEADTIDDVRGRPLLDFVAPEHRAEFRALHRSVMAGGNGQLRFVIVGLKGTRRWLETHAVPYRSGEGRIEALLGVTRDITDHKLADDALRERERRLTSIYDTVGDSIFHIAVEGGGRYLMLSVNQAFLATTGLSSEQVVGRRIDEIIPFESLPLVLDRYATAIRTRSSVTWEETSDYPTGRRIGAVRISPVFDDSGTCTHLVGSVRDITREKQDEAAARLAAERLHSLSRRLLEVREEERRQLASELHDELGQALTATKINLESLRRYPDPGLLASRLDDSVAIVERALQQVRSLSLELRPPMLDDLGLDATLRWLADQHARRSHLAIEITGNLMDGRVDQAIETACFRIAQEAFNNVVRHARASTVRVDLERRDGLLHLRVTDDGAGFPVDDARLSAARGMSLGVLGMEERAVLAGGGINWESAPGQGTTVHAWFPLDHRAGTSPTPR